MNCHEVNRLLETTDAIDRSAAEKRVIEEHFAACRDCWNAWASFTEIAAERIPAMSPSLHAAVDRIVAARLPARAWPVRRAFLFGGVLVLGAAAAAVVWQGGLREQEILAASGEAAPEPGPPAATAVADSSSATAPSTGIGAEGKADAGEPPTAAAGAGAASDDASAADSPALDPRSVVVIATAGGNADADALAILDECHRGVVARLGSLPGLNVISGLTVTAFQDRGMADVEIARELGAGSVLAMDTRTQCSALLFDTRSGEFIAGRGLAFGEPELDWEYFYDGIARQVGDALLIDQDSLLAQAQAIFLDATRDVNERLAALTRPSDSGNRLRAVVGNAAVISGLIQIMTTSADAQNRRSAVLFVSEIDDDTIVDPLLHVLTHDADSAVRVVAASVLHEYVDEPRVRDTLLAVVAEDREDDPSVICCQGGVGEAARRALASDDELLALADEQLMNSDLSDTLRLQPFVEFLDRDAIFRRGLDGEQSNAIFSIGRDSADPTIRYRAWTALAGGVRNPDFVPTLLDDLSHHDVEDVRHAAAQALVPYADDADVRPALEQALETDDCDCLRSILGPALQAE